MTSSTMSSSSSQTKSLSETNQVWSSIRPFVIGGLSGSTATCCIQPIDMVKVRIQLQGEGVGGTITRNPVTMAGMVIKESGIPGLYKGLSAAILRQLTYGTTRLGIYRSLTNNFTPEGGTVNDIPFWQTLIFSLCAGGIGALVGTPADAALVRMQSDSTLPVNERRGYTNAFNALYRMATEEGLKGFFAGAYPTIVRGLAINVGMLTTYDPMKNFLTPYLGDSQVNKFGSGAFSGWFAATVSLPFDFLKTRLQKDHKGVYNGLADCFKKTVQNEGFFALYQGYSTFVVRITPHIMLTWVFMDNYKMLFNKAGL